MMADPDANSRADADVFKRLYPERYFEEFINKAVRPDGRPLAATRDISIATGLISTANASALVKIGSSSALACIKCEVAIPPFDAPDTGRLIVQVELPPLCSTETRPGKSPDAALVITDQISTILNSPATLDLKQLCIDEGAAMWVAYLDIYVLDSDGALLDTCLLAAVAALSSLTLDNVALDEDGNVKPADANDGDSDVVMQQPLQLASIPIALTSGLYHDNLIVDTTNDEEKLMHTRIQVVVDDQSRVVATTQLGGGGADASQLQQCIEATIRRSKQARQVLQKALASSSE